MKKLLPVFGMVLLLVAVIFAAGCVGTGDESGNQTATPTTSVPTATPDQLKIATTTSLYDTGLLDSVQDYYLTTYNVDLLITSQGTGKAIQSAKNGDVDVLLVHAPAQEAEFMDSGFGVNHRGVAYNYFVIVGPESDPAGIKNMTPEEGLTTLKNLGEAGNESIIFVSRGDNSGTHSAEKAIWAAAGFNYTADISGNPGNWYVETGSGMGDTLTVAGQKQAYTLTDEATFLTYKKNNNLPLVPIIDEGETLLNRYTVITISPEKFPDTNVDAATNFTNWLISADGQKFIGDYGKEVYGKSLFSPMVTLADSTLPPFNIDSTTPVTVPTVATA
ncbi:substrate-binding domain-containing protein [Methanorbis rubei]|uniref:Tungstate-binding protein TupA n=1 Tax=Methanorbis rubei TaxID=3028300 RepID=A0AAE4MH47_9EURY|nr:Tungstate-binding protein TupA [Methanocorpusculaceae archaeon Cs1]